MTLFKVVKKLSLDFFGKGWEGAYINFQALTVKDIKDKFPEFTKIDEKDETAALRGIDTVLELLKEKFISGKGINDEGKLVDLKPGDLENLPAEIISRALSFLSQGVAAPSPKLLETS
jgi:hypothetical protein